jgi:tetratricopeptide (TPR) repeat protein
MGIFRGRGRRDARKAVDARVAASPEAALAAGMERFNAGDMPAAARALEHAAGSNDSAISTPAALHLGLAYLRLGEFAAAEGALAYAASRGPYGIAPFAAFYLGIAQERLGKPEAALQAYDRAQMSGHPQVVVEASTRVIQLTNALTAANAKATAAREAGSPASRRPGPATPGGGLSPAAIDAFANAWIFFLGAQDTSESRQSIAEFLVAIWPSVDPKTKKWLPQMPQIWEGIFASWNKLDEPERSALVKKWQTVLLPFANHMAKLHKARKIRGPSTRAPGTSALYSSAPPAASQREMLRSVQLKQRALVNPMNAPIDPAADPFTILLRNAVTQGKNQRDW